jgi:ssDNA-binding Zn-finger/Zn-ribbon topoisomerase 1
MHNRKIDKMLLGRCPFCGHKALKRIRKNNIAIGCWSAECHFKPTITLTYKNKNEFKINLDKAITAWNHRKSAFRYKGHFQI